MKSSKYEVESLTPEDRKFKNSSYAVDVEDYEKLKVKLSPYFNSLDWSSLKPNTTYKYKDLCLLIGDKECRGNKWVSQKRKWCCLFDYIVCGRDGIMINEVYDEPHYEKYQPSKYDSEIKSIYSEYIYRTLLLLLYRPKDDGNDFYEIKTTKQSLFKLLGFANHMFFQNKKYPGDYFHGNENERDMSEEEKVTFYKEVSNNINLKYIPTERNMVEKCFYHDVDIRFNTILSRALEDLHRRKKINYYYYTRIKVGSVVRNATKTEAIKITNIEGKCLNKYGCEEINEVFEKGKQDEFYADVQEVCKSELYIDKYWDEIDIWVAKDNVETGILRTYQRELGLGDDITVLQQQIQEQGALAFNRIIVESFKQMNDKIALKYSGYDPNLLRNCGYEVGSDKFDLLCQQQIDLFKKYCNFKDYKDMLVDRYIVIRDYFNSISQTPIKPIRYVSKSKVKSDNVGDSE